MAKGSTVKFRLIIITAGAAMLLVYIAVGAERHISSDRFCTSCHTMSYPAEELKASRHFGRLGIRPQCQDCHMPKGLFARIKTHIEEGVRDTIGEMRAPARTKEDFEKRRAGYAHRSRAVLWGSGSAPCKECHRQVHAGFPGADKGGLNCINCHQNLVHGPAPQEDIEKGIQEGRIVLK